MSKPTSLRLSIVAANSVSNFGGHLECTVCHKKRQLGDTIKHFRSGWPKHCGYTMLWVTRKQEKL